MKNVSKNISKKRNCESWLWKQTRKGNSKSRVWFFNLKKKALILPHYSSNFEIKTYYQNEPRFNGVYSRDKLPKTIKNGAYVINLDEYADVGKHWITLHVKNNEVIYFDSFGVEHVPKEIKEFIGHKNIKTNIFRIQASNSIMCGYFALDSLILCLQAKL